MINVKQMLAEAESKPYLDELGLEKNTNNLKMHLEGEGYRSMYRSFRKAGLKTESCKAWFPIWIQADRYFSETGIDDLAISSRYKEHKKKARELAFQIACQPQLTQEEQDAQDRLGREAEELSSYMVPLYVFLRRQGFTEKEITS